MMHLSDNARIKFTTNFTNTELQHKIIEIYDLKTTGMFDTRFKQKILKNKEFLEQMYIQESEEKMILKLKK